MFSISKNQYFIEILLVFFLFSFERWLPASNNQLTKYLEIFFSNCMTNIMYMLTYEHVASWKESIQFVCDHMLFFISSLAYCLHSKLNWEIGRFEAVVAFVHLIERIGLVSGYD